MKKGLHNLLNSNLLVCLLTILTGFALYSFSLSAPFKTMDDNFSIIENPLIQSFDNVGEIFTSSFFKSETYYRPMVYLTFMIERHFFDLNSFYFYLTNILLHLASSLIVFFLLKILLRDEAPWVAAVCAFLFCVHPVHWEAVSNIPGRAILLCGFFVFCSMYLFLRASAREGGAVKFSQYAFSLVFFALALFSKETAAMLPAVLCFLCFMTGPQSGLGGGQSDVISPSGHQWLISVRSMIAQRFMKVIPYFVLLAGYLILRRAVGITNVYDWGSVSRRVLAFVTFLRGMFDYVRIMILPLGLRYDRSAQVFAEVFSFEVWATIAVYVTAAVVLIMDRCRRWKQLELVERFFLIWVAIQFFPVSQIYAAVVVRPGYISLAEHFLYIPSVPMIALIVLAVNRICKWICKTGCVNPKVLIIIAFAYIVFLMLTTVQQNIYSSSETSMFERTLEYDPHNNRIRNSLALGYVKQGNIVKAEQHFREVLKADPFDVRARIGLGKALCDQDRYWEGIIEYGKVRAGEDLKELLENNLTLSYNILRDKLLLMIKADSKDPEVYFRMSFIESKMGDEEAAASNYKKALELKLPAVNY